MVRYSNGGLENWTEKSLCMVPNVWNSDESSIQVFGIQMVTVIISADSSHDENFVLGDFC